MHRAQEHAQEATILCTAVIQDSMALATLARNMKHPAVLADRFSVVIACAPRLIEAEHAGAWGLQHCAAGALR
jgi:hypothetical protein